jgi:Lambda phage tail tape-measure protein (Tape_meas_lam_C)
MAVTVGTLQIDLRANTASFSQSMDKMSQLSAKTANDIKRSLEKITTAGLAMASAIAAGTTALLKSALDQADALGKTAQAAGTTAETLSVLEYAAKLSNVETGKLAVGLEKLAANAFKAQNGGSQLQRIFENLHISVANSNGRLKDSGLLLEELAVKFAKMGDSSGKTALARELFGKSGAELIPLLNQLGSEQAKVTAEAQRFGLVLSTSTVEVAEKAHDNLDRLESMLKGIGFSLLSATLPALDQFIEKLTEIADKANFPDLAKAFGTHVTNAITNLGNALEFAAKHANALQIALKALLAYQTARIALPIAADLLTTGSDKLGSGVLRFVESLTGVGRVTTAIGRIGGEAKTVGSGLIEASKAAKAAKADLVGLGTATGPVVEEMKLFQGLNIGAVFSSMLASLQSIPGTLRAVATGLVAMGRASLGAALSNPYVAAIAAIVALGVVLFAFRKQMFTLRGETFQLRDVFSATWIAIGEGFSWLGKKFSGITDKIAQLWKELMAKLSQASWFRSISKGFEDALGSVTKLLGKLTPQWALDALKEAKRRREAEEAAERTKHTDDNTVHPPPPLPPDTSGQGKQPRTDPIAIALANLRERVQASRDVLAASGLEADAQRKVNAQIAAHNVLLKLGEEIAKQRNIKTNDFIKLVPQYIQDLFAAGFAESSDNEAISKRNDLLGESERETIVAVANAQAMIAAIQQGTAAVMEQTAAQQAAREQRQLALNDDEKALLQKRLLAQAIAQNTVSIAQEVQKLKEEAAQQGIISEAILGTIDAQRSAALSAKLFDINKTLANSATDDKTRQQLIEKRDAIIALTNSENRQRDIESALDLLSPSERYAREADALDHSVKALAAQQNGMLTYGQRLQIAAKAQDQFNRMIEDSVNLLLQEGTARDGVTAFFLDMQRQAVTTGRIVYEALKSAFDKLADNLTELVTGGKTSFGKMFEDLGKQMINATIKQQLQESAKALGKAGKDGGIVGRALSTLTGKQKYDGSSPSTALWVQLVGPGGVTLGSLLGGSPSAGGAPTTPPFLPSTSELYNVLGLGQETIPGFGGSTGTGTDAGKGGATGGILSSIFGGGLFKSLIGMANDSNFFSSLFGGKLFGSGSFFGGLTARASGGSVSPDSAYLVGEKGPEILTGVSGNIYSNTESRRRLGGGGGNILYYSIDARGTDPVETEQRTRAALIATHSSSVNMSVRVSAEHMKRTPQR